MSVNEAWNIVITIDINEGGNAKIVNFAKIDNARIMSCGLMNYWRPYPVRVCIYTYAPLSISDYPFRDNTSNRETAVTRRESMIERGRFCLHRKRRILPGLSVSRMREKSSAGVETNCTTSNLHADFITRSVKLHKRRSFVRRGSDFCQFSEERVSLTRVARPLIPWQGRISREGLKVFRILSRLE